MQLKQKVFLKAILCRLPHSAAGFLEARVRSQTHKLTGGVKILGEKNANNTHSPPPSYSPHIEPSLQNQDSRKQRASINHSQQLSSMCVQHICNLSVVTEAEEMSVNKLARVLMLTEECCIQPLKRI